MFIVLGIIILGILIGTQIRSSKAPSIISKLLNAIIYLLLLVMGIAVGGNEQIVNNLPTIGLKALIITAGAVLGSAIFAAVLYRYLFKNRKAK
ncbi:MAG: LysO family transporter [Rikenellaceae bacterium]